MNRKRISKSVNVIYLKAAITESILLSSIKGSSFSEIKSCIPRVISTSEGILREYIHYLVNNSFISYNRLKKVYLIEAGGWNLLFIIYSRCTASITNYLDLIIEIEANNDSNDLEYQGKRTDYT